MKASRANSVGRVLDFESSRDGCIESLMRHFVFPSCYSLVIGHWDTQSSALDMEYLPMLILDMTYKPHIARRLALRY